MIIRCLTGLLLTCTALFAAPDDGWEKVRQAKSGSELRIYKKGAAQPVMARLDEATDDALRVVIKNEQVSIPKADIDRIDSRDPATKRTKTESKSDPLPVDPNAARPAPGPSRTPGPSGNWSSGMSIGKADFQLLWRRTGAPAK